MLKHLHNIGRRDLAAQVQQVLYPQQSFGAAFVQCRNRQMLGLAAGPALVHVADHHRVEHSDDAGRGAQRIMHDGGRVRIPQHARAWHQMFFKVVGVQLDQAGQQPVAVPVLGTGHRRVAAVHRADQPAFQHHATGELFGGRDHSGVPDDLLLHASFLLSCSI